MIPNPSLALLGKKIAFSTMIQYAGKGVQIILGAVTLKLISGALSQGQYGLYGTITEYALFFSVIGNLGIFAQVVRKMADEPLNGKIFINSLFLRVITALGFFAVALLILLFTGADQLFLIGTLLFLGVLFFDFVTSICDGMLQANYMMGRAIFALLVGKVLTFGITWFVVVKIGFSATEADITHSLLLPLIFLASIAGSFVTALISFFFVRQKIVWEWHIDRKFWFGILKASLPFGIINLVNNLYFRFLPDYFSHQILPSEGFATFNISFRLAQVISLFSTFLMFSALPGLKEYIDAKHWVKAHSLYKKIWKILTISGVLVVVIGSFLGPYLIELLTHKKYFLPELWFLFPLMLLLAAISYGYDLVLITLFAFEEEVWFLRRECVALLVSFFFFGAFIFIPNVQIQLVLIISGAIVAETLMVVLGAIKVDKILKSHHQKALKPL